MLKTLKLPEKIEDTLKVLIAIKVLIFVLLSAIESSLVINELYIVDECIQEISKKFENNDDDLSKAKAVHFCAGGHLIDPELIK